MLVTIAPCEVVVERTIRRYQRASVIDSTALRDLPTDATIGRKWSARYAGGHAAMQVDGLQVQCARVPDHAARDRSPAPDAYAAEHK